MVLEEHLNDFRQCVHCNVCKIMNFHRLGDWIPSCPPGYKWGYDAYYSLGRMEIGRWLAEGKVKEPSRKMLEILYTCSLCGACSEICKEFTFKEPATLFEKIRTVLVEDLGWGPLEEHKKFRGSIEENRNPYFMPHEKRLTFLEEAQRKEKAEVVYFVGCTTSYREQEIARATVKVLNTAGVDYTVMDGDEWCCSSPLLRTGYRKIPMEYINHNVEAIKKRGAKKVITSCAGCYRALKKDYPELLGEELGFEMLHSSEYFLELIKQGKITPKKEIKKKVTYHDPCHLGRHLGVYEPPRELLKSIPGIELVEMLRNRQDAWCCASGAGVKSAFGDFATWTAGERINEVESLGLNEFTSACPFCAHNFKDSLEKTKKDIKMYDVVELLAESLE